MTSTADISGSFRRPSLVDYLIVAEHMQLSLGLRLWVGALEVGLIGVLAGEVVHAELPGASGEGALSLLAKLPARVTPEAWGGNERTVRCPWRERIDEQQWSASPGRAQRLAAIRSELAELAGELAGELADDDLPRAPLREGDPRARRIAAELLDWVAVETYLQGQREQARALLSIRERAYPGDLLCAANLERLRLRLLEDDITTSVRGVDE